MKNFKILFCLMVAMLFSSCSHYVFELTSRGVEPKEKTYYLSSPDSAWTTTLEFKEYAQPLKKILSEKGYEEASPEEAELCILLDYQLDQAYFAGTTSRSSTTTYTNTSVKGNTSTSGTANATSSTLGNSKKASATSSKTSTSSGKVTSSGVQSTSTETTNRYVIPLCVSIVAEENDSKQPVWEVILNYKASRTSEVSSVIPWMFPTAQPYIGISSNGEKHILTDRTKKLKERYNLP